MPRRAKKTPVKGSPPPVRRLTRSHSKIGNGFTDDDNELPEAVSPRASPCKRARASSSGTVRNLTNGFDAEHPRPSTSAACMQNIASNGDKDSDDPEVQEIIHQMEVTRKILGMNCVDVVNRLNLTWIPPCVRDQQYCRSRHHRKCPRPKKIDHLQSYLVKVYSQYNRHIHYLRAVLDMCTRMEFPGEESVRKILEIVLVSKQPDESPHSTDYILQYCLVVLETVIMKFPPCWPDIKQAYRNIFVYKIDVKLYYPDDAGSERTNIVVFLLTLLAETMDIDSEDTTRAGTKHALDQESESEYVSYHDYFSKSSVQDNFQQHSREGKLDRLFATLSVLTKILEYDFAIWLLRYPSKMSAVMFSENAPLLAHVFFDGTFHTITASVKKLLEIFVKCTHSYFPQDKIDILSRLISLLSVAMNSCETQPQEELIYPNIGKSAVAFAKEIYKTVFDRFGTNVECFLAVIKNIKIPFVRYLLYDQLILKFDGPTDTKYMNVRKVHELMRKEKWKCSLGVRKKDTETVHQKYPNVPKKIVRPKVGEIFRHEYMDLIVDCLRSYCETFQVRRVIREVFAKKPITSPQSELPLPAAETISGKTYQYRLDKMEEEIQSLETQLNRKMRCRVKEEVIVPFTGIFVNNSTLISYRDDVKYLGLLLCDIKKLIQTEDRVLFKSCYLFLNDILKV